MSWQVLCAVLVVRLLTDLATPLMPGAFRFNPEESVDGLRAHPVRAAQDAAARPAGPPSAGIAGPLKPETVTRRPGQEEASPIRFGPLLARRGPDPSSEASEDPLILTIPVA